ncbi:MULTISPECIES: hypothetical protein [unclassified Roseateles]|uniref:hypothetical protein n=1 Tax=unclassified Roseateles TaxID=2626991 RepID=UPI0012E37A3C|nr:MULTISPECIES: hypothetical protein [unclassified Roseateles]
MNNTTTTTTKFSLASRMGAWWADQRANGEATALRRRCPPATVAADQIPASIRSAWALQAPEELPGLATDDAAWLRCSLGLAQFFEGCRLQRECGPCALPSKAADSVWHVWLKVDPGGLAVWQERYFSRVVEHRGADDLGAPLDDCLARTWVGACRSEGKGLLGPQLPLVFALDGLLCLPTGWAYQHKRGALLHRQIDGFGQPGGAAFAHASVAAAGLVALGLISEAELISLRRQQAGDSGGATGGPVDAGSCSVSDGGGCSCGSGCGGGS